MTSITEAETASLKFHLNYGSISADAAPYVDFTALFEQVIAPNLTSGAETASVSPITQGACIVTPAAMTGIVPYVRLMVDVGDDHELITVQSIGVSSFTARFQRAHLANCPLAVLGGLQRLRLLLNQADVAHAAIQDQSIGATAGLRQVDKSDVEWQPRFRVLTDRRAHYAAIQQSISSLVRVPVNGAGSSQHLSVY